MVESLTPENLQKGEKLLQSNPNSKGEGELKTFFENNKNTNKIFKVLDNNNIDCNKYNYYYEKYMGKFGRPFYVTKIDSIIPWRCNEAVKSTEGFVYSVEKSITPPSEGGFLSGMFKKSAPPLPEMPTPPPPPPPPADANQEDSANQEDNASLEDNADPDVKLSDIIIYVL